MDRKALTYFILGVLALPIVTYFFNGQNTQSAMEVLKDKTLGSVVLGITSVLGVVVALRMQGIIDKFNNEREYAKFFMIFMFTYALVGHYLAGYSLPSTRVGTLSLAYIIKYFTSVFIAVYIGTPKKTDKLKTSVIGSIIGYILFAGTKAVIGGKYF